MWLCADKALCMPRGWGVSCVTGPPGPPTLGGLSQAGLDVGRAAPGEAELEPPQGSCAGVSAAGPWGRGPGVVGSGGCCMEKGELMASDR